MAAIFDASSSAVSARNDTTLTFAHTCSGTNRTLVVVVNDGKVGGATPTGVTYNGVAMTLADNSPTSDNEVESVWILANPASGTNNIVVTCAAGNLWIVAGGISFTNTAAVQNGAHSNAGPTSSTTASGTLTTTASGSAIVTGVAINDTLAVTSPTAVGSTIEKLRLNSDALSGVSSVGGYQIGAGAGSYTNSWTMTSVSWRTASVEVLPLITTGIGLDTTTSSSGSGTSLTYAHTCTSATLLIIDILVNAAQTVSTVTYNGVSCTNTGLTRLDGGGFLIASWYLVNPASGTNNIVITPNASTSNIFGRSASYTGTDTATPMGASTTAQQSGTSIVTSITTLTNNSWVHLFARAQNQNIVAGTGSTRRSPTGATSADTILFDSNAAISPAGSTSMTVTPAALDTVATIMWEIKPTAAATTNAAFLLNFI